TPKGGAIATTHANDIVFTCLCLSTSAGIFTFSSPSPAGTNLTSNQAVNTVGFDNRVAILTHIVTATTTETPQVTSSRTGAWQGVTFAIKDTTSGSVTPPYLFAPLSTAYSPIIRKTQEDQEWF